MAQIGSLSVKLGLVTVEWDKATDNAKRSAKELQTQFDVLGNKVQNLSNKFKSFTGVGAALGLGFLYHEAVALTDEIDDLSKSFGLSTGEILAFRDALQQSGGKAESADKALNTLFGKIADAKSGNDSAIAQFEKLGIAFGELKTLSPYEAIQKVASGFSNITDQFEKTKAIKDVLGKAGIGVDLENVAAALKKGTGEFDKYNESIKKVGQVSDALKKNLTNLTLAFADLIAPLSQSQVIKIETFSAALKGIAAGAAVAAIATMAVNFKNLAVAINAAAAAGALFNLTAGGATPIGLIIKAVTAATAIGTFIYVTGSAANESGISNSDFDRGAAEEERQKRLKLGQIPNKSPFVGKTPNLGTLLGRPLDQRGQFMPDGSFKAPETQGAKNDGSVSNEAKSLNTQIALTKELTKLDREKNAFDLNTTKTELEKKLNDIEIERQKKLKQTDAETRQKIASSGDTMTAALKGATYADAEAKKIRINQEATDAKALANLQDRLRLNKEDIQNKQLAAEILLDAEKNAFDMDMSKTELQKRLNEIEITKRKKFAEIDAEASQKMAGGSNVTKEALAEAEIKKRQATQEATDAAAMANLQNSLRGNQNAIENQKLSAEILLESERSAFNMDVSKTELEKQLNDIEINRRKKIAQIEAEANGRMPGEFGGASDALKKQQVNQEARDESAILKQKDRLRLIQEAIEAERQLAEIDEQNMIEAFGFYNAQIELQEAKKVALAKEAVDAEEAIRIESEQNIAEAAGFYNAQILEEAAKRVVLAREALEAEEAIRQESEQTTAEAWSYVDAKIAAQKAFHDEAEENRRITNTINERLFYENKLAILSDKQRQNLMNAYDLEAGIVELKRQADKLGIDTTSEAFENFIDKLKTTRQKTIELKQDQEDFQKTFTYGWFKAFNEYADNAENAALRAQDIFKSMTDVLTNSINEFVDTGTVAWDRLIENIIKGMLKAELQRQASQLFSLGFNAIRGLFGGNPIAPAYDIPVMSAHASGGVASANTLSIVGERGPELFMPKTSGAIIPNNQLSAMGGGQTINYNGPYIASMNAIDTQSGVQFLSKNKQAVWATYQSANRSIPMSR